MWLLLLMNFQFAGDGHPINEVVVSEHARYDTFEECVSVALRYNQVVDMENSTGVCVKRKLFYPGLEPKVRF